MDSPATTGQPPRSTLRERLFTSRPGEGFPVALSGLHFFFVLASYYVLKPIREQMGLAGGVENLPWLYTGTLLGTLLLVPLFSKLVARTRRAVFLPLAYRFFLVNLLVFFVLLRAVPEDRLVWVGRAFYVWVSVFNLFVVSLFWSFMADVWKPEQGKRLFGMIGIGGTIGAITGSQMTSAFVAITGVAPLLIVSAVFLEAAVRVMQAIARRHARDAGDRDALALAGEVASPSPASAVPAAAGLAEWIAGVRVVARSPYLLAVCGFLFFFTLSSTFLYFEQARIVAASITDKAAQTRFFASINLWVNVLTLVIQVGFTGRIVRALGIGPTLALLPAVVATGFAALALSPTPAVLAIVQVVRQATNYALAKPSREALFTVVERAEKYAGKSFIDTFVYRGGDLLGAWLFDTIARVASSAMALAAVGMPLALVWAALGILLGRGFARRQPSREPVVLKA